MEVIGVVAALFEYHPVAYFSYIWPVVSYTGSPVSVKLVALSVIPYKVIVYIFGVQRAYSVVVVPGSVVSQMRFGVPSAV